MKLKRLYKEKVPFLQRKAALESDDKVEYYYTTELRDDSLKTEILFVYEVEVAAKEVAAKYHKTNSGRFITIGKRKFKWNDRTNAYRCSNVICKAIVVPRDGKYYWVKECEH
jgi:hypothetical protein